ncbi:hypothetical protein BGZ72_009006, partial [Mortierella alpina]
MISNTILSPSLRPVRETVAGPDSRQHSPLSESLSPAGSPAGEQDTTFSHDSAEGDFPYSQVAAISSPLRQPASSVVGGEAADPAVDSIHAPAVEPTVPLATDTDLAQLWKLKGYLHTLSGHMGEIEARYIAEENLQSRIELRQMWENLQGQRVFLQDSLRSFQTQREGPQYEQYAAMVRAHAETVREQAALLQKLGEHAQEQAALARAYWTRTP